MFIVLHKHLSAMVNTEQNASFRSCKGKLDSTCCQCVLYSSSSSGNATDM